MRTRHTPDGPTQPVPSAPSLSSSVANSSPDVCASLLTTTLDGRTEGSSPLFISVSSLTAIPQALVLSIGNPITIGRNPKLWFASPNFPQPLYQPPQVAPMSSPTLSFLVSIARYMRKSRSPTLFPSSSLPCSVRSGAGGIIISCQVLVASLPFAVLSISRVQDLSTNGIAINGHKIRKTSSILMHGDTLKIPASQGKPSSWLTAVLPDLFHSAFQCVLNSRHLPAARPHTVLSQHQAFKVRRDSEVRTFSIMCSGLRQVSYHLTLSRHRQLCVRTSCSRYIRTSPSGMQDHSQERR